MGEPALKTSIAVSEAIAPKTITTTARQKVRNTFTEELIIGICAPIGSLRQPVIDELIHLLRTEYNYDVEVIKLSLYIETYKPIPPHTKPGETPTFTSLMDKIKGGDELREESNPAVLAQMAIQDIHLTRYEGAQGTVDMKPIEDLESRRKCFVIDSIKNKEELELLRDLYKDIFYLFSIFSPIKERQKILSDKGLSPNEIITIMETDNFENNSHGQNVKDTFVNADFFVRVSTDNLNKLSEKISRYINIIFDNKIITPYPHENAMYEAQSVAGNSACLSRQVGAAITNEKGEVISRGWNDVPKYGGNLYSEGDTTDARCKHAGYCMNDITKDVVTNDIITAVMEDANLISTLFGGRKIQTTDAEYLRVKEIVRKNTKIKDLIEFSRSVHAEMHAIIIGSQLAGDKMVGGKLFCTTYPCHNCARHLIVAGIEEIYYIEPYSKSLSLRLHEDAITENENETGKVKLLVYDGVAPRRYLEFFLMNRPRKNPDGKVNFEFPNVLNPKTMISLQALPRLEQQAIHALNEKGLSKKQ